MEQVEVTEADKAAVQLLWMEHGPWRMGMGDTLAKYFAHHRVRCDQAKDEEIAELAEALAELWRVIDIAGLSNLARGVQLGQVSWFVKASDAVEQARATLAKHQDNPRG